MAVSDDAVLELIFNPEAQGMPLSSVANAVDTKPEIQLDASLVEELQAMERSAIAKAEEGDVQAALDILNSCVQREEKYASAYNNRAQLHRLMKNDDLALADLEQVFRFGQGQPKILRQAYTQRAIIRRMRGDNEGSLKDFELGAKYGNPVARSIAVNENPYAKMCNQVMMEVMARERQHLNPSSPSTDNQP